MTSSRLTESLAALRGVLANRDLRRIALAYFAFACLEYGTWVALLVYAYQTTGPAAVGIVAFGQLVPSAFFAAIFNGLGDRYRRDRVLLAGYAALAVSSLVVGAAMLADLPASVVYLSAVAVSCGVTIPRPLQSALTPSYADTAQQVASANGLLTLIDGLGVLVGPLLAALVLVEGSPGVVFVGASVLGLVAAVLAVTLRPHRAAASIAARAAGPSPTAPTSGVEGVRVADAGGHGPRVTEPPRPGLLAGSRQVLADTDQRLLVLMLGARFVIIGAMDVLIVLMAIEALGIGGAGAGILTAALGLGGVGGGAVTLVLVGRARLVRWLAAGAVGWGMALLGVSAVEAAWPAAMLLAVGGIALALIEVAGRTLLQRLVPDAVLAGVFGLVEGFAMAGLAIGSILPTILVERVGLPATLVVTAAILPTIAAIAWLPLARAERRMTIPIHEIARLRGLSLFAPVPAPALEAAARALVPVAVRAGEAVIRQGDVGDAFYVIDDGELVVSQDGHELRRLGPGTSFGEIALIRDVPRTASVTAVTDARLLALEREAFLLAITGSLESSRVARRIADAYPDVAGISS